MTDTDARMKMKGTSSVVKFLIRALAVPIADGMVISTPPNTENSGLGVGEYRQSVFTKEVMLAMRDVGEMGV